jgi:sterol-4alpha-carboxylate 3-dehydrogenase (decarboxylating)
MADIEQKKSLGNVTVVGGTGFLGHHIVNLLLEQYQTKSISVIDLHTSRNRRPASDGVKYFEADITNISGITTVFQTSKPDVVIHTASPLAQGEVSSSRALFKKVNVDGTRCIVEACQATGVKALVYTSSASVISDNKSDLINADEKWPVIRGAAQTEYYTETKVGSSSWNAFIEN